MGQIAGTLMTRDVCLQQDDLPTFNPTAGFSSKRQVRQAPPVSNEHLSSAKIPMKYRDYCSDYLLQYQVCRYKHFPILVRCSHERHSYLNCEQKDYVLRMKEFERERRLRVRENKLKECDGKKPEPCAPEKLPEKSPPPDKKKAEPECREE